MSPALDYQVEQLLIQWWEYDSAYRGAPRGCHAAAFYGGDYHGNVHSSANDMLKESQDYNDLNAVGGAVASLDRDHREAVEISMINITSVDVWRSNRLGVRLDVLYVEAKVMLVPLLRSRRVEI